MLKRIWGFLLTSSSCLEAVNAIATATGGTHNILYTSYLHIDKKFNRRFIYQVSIALVWSLRVTLANDEYYKKIIDMNQYFF